MKAIVYPRVSSLKQVDNTSLKHQEEECCRWCKSNDVDIVKVFTERGESAKTDDRKELQAALEFIALKKDINYFVVYKVDRFSRKTRDFLNLIETLAESGCKLVSVTEPLDDTPTGTMMATVLSAYAQFDNDIRSERSKNGMIDVIEKGGWAWIAPTGFKLVRTKDNIPTLIHDKKTAPIIADVFKYFATRNVSQKDLLEYATKKGLLTKTGKKLRKQTLNKILTNPAYASRITTALTKGERQGGWEPIVDPKIFDICQGKLTRKGRVKGKLSRSEFPLKSTVFCAKCEQALIPYYATGKLGKKYPYYKCDKCRGQNISMLRLNWEFESLLDKCKMDVSFFDDIKKMLQNTMKNNAQERMEARDALEKQILNLRADEKRLLDLVVRGVIDETSYQEKLHDVRTKLISLDEEFNNVDFEVYDFENAIGLATQIFSNPKDIWAKSNSDMKIQLQDMWFSDGLLYDGKRQPRTRLTPKAVGTYNEIPTACRIWYPLGDSNPGHPD